MKKALILLVLLIAAGLNSVCADTVLFCISDNRNEENPSPWTQSVLRAFEDGVMDAFFESGNIVTNSFLNECRKISGEGVNTNADVARVMGNRLGADAVMILEIFFPAAIDDVLPVPQEAGYALYTNTGRTIASEQIVQFEIPVEIGPEELLDTFTGLGRDIAGGLASRL